jgi:hypothetical protein
MIAETLPGKADEGFAPAFLIAAFALAFHEPSQLGSAPAW